MKERENREAEFDEQEKREDKTQANTKDPPTLREIIGSIVYYLLCSVLILIIICNLTIIIKGIFKPEEPPTMFGVAMLVDMSDCMYEIDKGDLIFIVHEDMNKLYKDAILIVATALLIFMIIFYIIIIKHDNYDIVKDLLYLTDKKDAISYMVTMYSLEMAPEKHLKQVLDAGYQIVISEDLLRESYDICQDGLDIGYETMQGLTAHNEKRVYLKPQLETASITVLHELGHILDKCNGTVSSTPEFKECYTEEKGLIRD